MAKGIVEEQLFSSLSKINTGLIRMHEVDVREKGVFAM